MHRCIYRRQPGFLLMEVLLGIALFAIFVSAVGYTLLYGQESTIMSGDRIRAVQYTEKALEAARAIRDGSFSSLSAGTHGVYINASNKWALTGSYTVASGGYITQVTIDPLSSDRVRLTAETKWKRGYARSGSVLLVSELTDWGAVRSIGNWSSITVQGSYTDGSTPIFADLAIYSGSYVFAASRSGNGLYVFDTSNLAAPVRINSSFSLGAGAYDIAIRGNVLYIATDDSSQEIRAYDISSPSSFSAASLLGSYNVQGSARARALAIAGDTLYIGATASEGMGEEEFYAVQITTTGGFSLLDSVNDDTSTVSMIGLSGTSAYLASSMDTGELRVVNIASGSNLALLGGYNLSDRTLDGMAIAVSGTSALLGTMRGTSIEELVLFDLEHAPPVSPPPGPWYKEGSGSVVGIAMDPTRCVAFFAADSGHKALQVANMQNKSTFAELTTYTSTTGVGRAVLYDLARDRLMFATDRSLYIFSPAASTGSCP